MSSEQPRRAGGSGGSPIGSTTAAIIIAVVAVVGGFFILKQINDDGGGSSDPTIETGNNGTGTVTTLPPGETTPGAVVTLAPGATVAPESTLPAPTTPSAAVTTGATVVVANASTVDGEAGRFTIALKGEKFTTGKAVNANIKLPVSVVYYVANDAAAQAVATYLSSLLGNIAVEPLPSTAPVDGGALADGVTVVLMLGSDKAGKTFAEAGAPSTTLPATPGATTPTTPPATPST